MRYYFDLQYRDELSYDQVLELPPGTMVEAQDGTKGLVILDHQDFKKPGFPTMNALLLFHPAYPALCHDKQGFVRFKVMKPAYISFHTDED